MAKTGRSSLFARWGVPLAVPALTWLATAVWMSWPPDTRGIDVAGGARAFVKHCGSCHFTVADRPAPHGPNLHDLGKSAATRQPGRTAAEYILQSILDPAAVIAPGGRPGMPPTVAHDLAPQEIRAIVAFLASLGGFPDYEEISQLEIPDRRSLAPPATNDITRQEMQIAEKVLQGKGGCLHCHSRHSVPEHTVFGPSLFAAGLVDPEVIREAVLEPDRRIKLGYECVALIDSSGRTISGRLISQTPDHLLIAIHDPLEHLRLRQIPVAEIETEAGELQVRHLKTSLMPAELGKVLDHSELEAVIRLIQCLN